LGAAKPVPSVNNLPVQDSADCHAKNAKRFIFIYTPMAYSANLVCRNDHVFQKLIGEIEKSNRDQADDNA